MDTQMIPRYTLLTMIAATLLYGATARADASTASFVQEASIANRFEVESGKLALEKSSNNAVKQFAQAMIDDHTKAGEQLNELTKNSDIRSVDTLDTKHQKLINRLQSLSGVVFDKAYVDIQNDAYRDTVSLFSSYAQSGDDPMLRGFARETLPVLKKHLQHVNQLTEL